MSISSHVAFSSAPTAAALTVRRRRRCDVLQIPAHLVTQTPHSPGQPPGESIPPTHTERRSPHAPLAPTFPRPARRHAHGANCERYARHWGGPVAPSTLSLHIKPARRARGRPHRARCLRTLIWRPVILPLQFALRAAGGVPPTHPRALLRSRRSRLNSLQLAQNPMQPRMRMTPSLDQRHAGRWCTYR